MFRNILLIVFGLLSVQMIYADITSNLFQNSFSSSNPSIPANSIDKNSIDNLSKSSNILLNKTVAIVNAKSITLLQLNREVDKIMASIPLAQRYNLSDIQIRRNALQNIIAQSVLLQLAERNNIQVSASEVDSSINDIATQNGVSVEYLKSNVEASGISFSDYTKQIKDQMMVNRIQQQAIAQQIYVSPKEVQKYISRHQKTFSQDMTSTKDYLLRNITVEIPKDVTEKERLFSLLQKMAIAINNGGLSFEDVAKQFSDAPNADSGGAINQWMSYDSIPSVYKSRVKRLKKDKTTAPFIVDDAIQMVYLEDTKENKASIVSQINEYYLYAIQVNLTPTMTESAAKNDLDRAKFAIDAGDDFKIVAEKHNQNYDYDDGNFGWVSPVEQPPVVPMTVFSQLKKLNLGELSEPFNTGDNSLMIVKYTDTRIYDAHKELEEQRALEAIFSEKAQEVYKTWIASMKDNAYIQILEEDLKTEDFY